MSEPKKQTVTVPTVETKHVTVPTVAGLKSALSGTVASAQSRGGATFDSAKAAAGPMLAAATAAVAPRLDEAKGLVEHDVLPRMVDTRDHLVEAKESFVEETLPKIIEAVTAAVAASSVAKSDALAKVRDSEAAHRAVDAAAVLKGQKVVQETRKKSGSFLSNVLATSGILAAAGALAWFFNKRANEQDDPWARPLADPYIPPVTGRDSSAAPTMAEAPVVGVGEDAPATYAPEAGQVSDVPVEDNDLIPQGSTQDIRVVDPLEFENKPEGDAPSDGRPL